MARRRGSGRGGYQRPSSPATTSGPGKFSARTDGGPGDLRMGRGLGYGENKQVNDLQSAAPMGGQQQGGAAPPAGGGPGPSRGPQGIFGPSERPGEPLTAGVDAGPGPGRSDTPVLPEDPNLLLKAIVQAVGPHPDLLRLVNRA